jgi:hypothetical protein
LQKRLESATESTEWSNFQKSTVFATVNGPLIAGRERFIQIDPVGSDLTSRARRRALRGTSQLFPHPKFTQPLPHVSEKPECARQPVAQDLQPSQVLSIDEPALLVMM